MTNQQGNNVKTGAVIMIGLLLLMAVFFVLGKNNSVFGSKFVLRTRFSNIDGLVIGNNVLFSGLHAGTVKDISIIDDTTFEVTMSIDSKIRGFIHKNALTSIGTEGFIGNKSINITQGPPSGQMVSNEDLLGNRITANMDEMMLTLSKTNANMQVISGSIKKNVLKMDSSPILRLLASDSVGFIIKSSIANLSRTTENASLMSQNLNVIVENLRKGRGTAGLLLTDTSVASSMKYTIKKIKNAGNNIEQMTVQVNNMVKNLNDELNNGNGSLHTMLKDTAMAHNLSLSIENIRKGTDGFNQNMEALKHNFLFRGYFKKQDEQKKKLTNSTLGSK